MTRPDGSPTIFQPAGQPPAPPPNGPRPNTGRAPQLLSVVALVTALLAALVSVVALSRSGAQPTAAGSAVTAAPTTPSDASTPAGDLTTDPAATTDPTAEPTSEPTDGPDPRGVFTPAYQQEKLRLQPSTARGIDLDLPSANSTGVATEFVYSGYEPAYKLDFQDVALAEVKSPAPTANDCAQELRRAPIDPTFAPSKGQLICVLTSAEHANDQGIRQKVVLLRVDAIGSDGTLNITVSAWNVPK